jgi:hypothetical protein
MSVHNGQGLNRRRCIAAAGTGLVGLSAAGLAATRSGSNRGRRQSVSNLADTVLEAFSSHRLVGLGEAHDLQNHHDVLEMLLNDPRLPEVIDDIVTELRSPASAPRRGERPPTRLHDVPLKHLPRVAQRIEPGQVDRRPRSNGECPLVVGRAGDLVRGAERFGRGIRGRVGEMSLDSCGC